MNAMRYQIWSNVSENPLRFLTGYEPEDAMFLSHEGELEINGSKQRQLNRLFEIFNQDDRPNGQKAHSLSVGDVVVLDGKAYAVQFVGWAEVCNWRPVIAPASA